MGDWLFRTLEKMMAMRETMKLRALEARMRRFAGSCGRSRLVSASVVVVVYAHRCNEQASHENDVQ